MLNCHRMEILKSSDLRFFIIIIFFNFLSLGNHSELIIFGQFGATAAGPACNTYANGYHCPLEGPTVLNQRLKCFSN